MTESGGISFLPYGKHDISDDDIAAVVRVMKSGVLTNGPTAKAFEDELARQVGANEAVAVSSGTAALHLAAIAAGLRPGLAAIVPAVTFLATASAVRQTGAEVVFADVDPNTGLMRPEDCDAALQVTKTMGLKAAAVLPVHLGGAVCDMPGLAQLADHHGLTVLEDACHALGASYLGQDGTEQKVGACRHADMALFSFHPVKTVAMGEGGAITLNNRHLAERLRRLRSHAMKREPEVFANAALAHDSGGRVNPWYYEASELGFNYRASDLHCALGLSQLHRLDSFLKRRDELAHCYDSLLTSLGPEILPVPRISGCRPGWHLYRVLIDFTRLGIERGTLMRRLQDQGIGSQVHYIPVPWQPFYARAAQGQEFPGAARYYERTLSLPLFPAMGDDDPQRVVVALSQALKAPSVSHD